MTPFKELLLAILMDTPLNLYKNLYFFLKITALIIKKIKQVLLNKNVLTRTALGCFFLKKIIIPNHYTSEFKERQMHALLEHYPHNNLERH